ncbi:hypothetical protein LTR91_002225 [Friedmanniomyces endolithicus]|uniref:MAPEG family protein n=1 Tax=Friedmanniomyces endolithicus TaxID=329885 RepID=A0AAN6L060_9PEZI|nr:hypothetical protein LTR35_015960 [Friedmanniomyces endolithicus]KAK0269059.1 hypothetical protein LTS00_017393 [Friedmanniomyces endolithicus]KAK0904469.1 hypothetical protein LTR57_018721 [Friedmanniomyces endolithicus]KAK1010941.1 hypothetical protein LTR91_002225 [Friedmanniomyces endolithicus]
MPSLLTPTPAHPLITPLLTLASWTFVMELWMYALRIPALSKYKVPISPDMTTADMNKNIPRHLQWPADNYNHLMEQPTVFYAVALALDRLEVGDSVAVGLAWTYVGLRVVHSVVQAAANPVMIFACSSVVLLLMTGKGVLAVM